jgi:hypothetical protein
LILIALSFKISNNASQKNIPDHSLQHCFITILSRHIFSLSVQRMMPDTSPALLRWDAIFFLIIPLVFIAWQFSLKQVLLYCLIVLVADSVPMLLDQNRE